MQLQRSAKNGKFAFIATLLDYLGGNDVRTYKLYAQSSLQRQLYSRKNIRLKFTLPDVNHVAVTLGSSRSRSSSEADRSKQHDSDIARLSAVGGDIRPRDVIAYDVIASVLLPVHHALFIVGSIASYKTHSKYIVCK